MHFDKQTNYIVSGLERSGTSMLMQILHAGGVPTAFDSSRPADESNPKGYFELEGGKIINKLMDGSFPLDQFGGTFIKITAFGLNYLPRGKYKIIYSERNLDEILDSMEKMAKIKDHTRQETYDSFRKLNDMIKNQITTRDDIDVLFVNYNQILTSPKESITKIYEFLGDSDLNLEKMIDIVDKQLYRQRRQHN
jgi:hypothetical protein